MGCLQSTANNPKVSVSPSAPANSCEDDNSESDFYLPLDTVDFESDDSNQLSSFSVRSDRCCVLSFSDYVALNPNTQIFEYQFIQPIGRGSHGEVFLCKNVETQDMYAAKVYSKNLTLDMVPGESTNTAERIDTEIKILMSVKDEHCLQMVDLFEDEYTQSIIIIMTLAKEGSLLPEDPITTPFSEKEAQCYFAQVAIGVNHLHSMNVVHRDIKPHNILKKTERDVLIGDYSVSAILQDDTDMFTDTEGTPMFFSPEECSGDPYLPKPADIWALGVSLYILIYGRPPFFEEDEAGIFLSHFYRISQLIQENDVVYDSNFQVSDSLIDLLNHLLDKNPKTRFTIEQTLNHQWVREGIAQIS